MTVNNKPKHVLFVCTGNAGRSQLAQAMYPLFTSETVEVESAGVEPWENLHPMAVKIMRERGVDDSRHHPKGVAAVADQVFDIVVSIGDPAREELPQQMKGNPQRIHWDIADPADADETPDSEAVFRQTLESIEQQFPNLQQQLQAI